MKTTPLFLVVTFAVASSAAASPSGDQRLADLIRTGDALQKVCREIKNWAVADGAGDITSETLDQLRKKGGEVVSPAAERRVKERDRDAAGLIPGEAAQLRRDVHDVRTNGGLCDQIMSKKSGLPRLLAPDARIEDITQVHWDALLDPLGEVAASFDGTDVTARNAPNYLKRYADDAGRHRKTPAGARLKLADAAASGLGAAAGPLARALTDALPSAPPAPAAAR